MKSPISSATPRTQPHNPGSLSPRPLPPPPYLELGWTRLGKNKKRPRPPTSTTTHATPVPSLTVAVSGGGDNIVCDTTSSVRTVITELKHKEEEECGENEEEEEEEDFWLWNEDFATQHWSCSHPECRMRREKEARMIVHRIVATHPPSTLRSLRDSTASSSSCVSSTSFQLIRGQVVWMLPQSVDSVWFQGYLFPPQRQLFSRTTNTNTSTSRSSTNSAADCYRVRGLLATQVSIDECLACVDGGYRRIAITLLDYYNNDNNDSTTGSNRGTNRTANATSTSSSTIPLGEADWTGGEMMKLVGGSTVRMRPRQLLTGDRAASMVTCVFASFWRNMVERMAETEAEGKAQAEAATEAAAAAGNHGDDDRDTTENNNHPTAKTTTTTTTKVASTKSVLELLPQVAVVWGDMEILVPFVNNR